MNSLYRYALPPYSRLALAIRAALYGLDHPSVRRMFKRNMDLELADAAEQLA